MTEHYTPSINIEPPPDSEEQVLFDSLGVFNEYCPSDSDPRMNFSAAGDRCYPPVPALFIQSSDSPNLSDRSEYPRYNDYSLGYSPATSGRSSPIESWSPASSFSGDIFPEDPSLSDDLRPHWAPQHGFSGHSSPALSPSLSPLMTAFNDIALEESYTGADQSVLPSGTTFSRLRSSSHSVPPGEGWVDGVGRGRSASFSAAPTTDNQFYRNEHPSAQGDFSQYGGYSDNSEVQISVADLGTTYSANLGTGMSWGSMPTDENGVNTAPGRLVTNWRYPSNGERPSTDSSSPVDPPPPSPSHLTVPPVGLQRKGASRRTRSVSDLNALAPSDQDAGRGRGQHRSALSIPSSRSISNGSRSTSPYGGHFHFRDVQTPASFSSSTPSSPAFDDAEAGTNEHASIERRRTFTAIRGSGELLPPVPALGRASSTPSKGRRSRATPSLTVGLGVFKAERAVSPHSSDGSQGGSQQEFRVSQPSPTPSFKLEVASSKIRQASSARRINAAAFKCTVPGCPSTFTARHNLINHINSHNKNRPHRCLCGMTFTTQGVLNRHKKRCRK
ncbi:hypothetical protein B0H11DRAFT_2237345 [Mycena galericulata]|nr:hypothetical protein B0H11DRAFT_2237345 [Mycena galericulata]